MPTRIIVKDVNIDLPVQKGYYDKRTQQWTLSLDKAQFAMVSTAPNSIKGNTYIYGHARQAVFARLLNLKSGSIAVVDTDKNQEFTYQLQRTIVTKPEDSSMLFYQGAPILTLQTCSGSVYQNRSLFVFTLVGVKSV